MNRTATRKATRTLAAWVCRQGLVRPRGERGTVALLWWWRSEIGLLLLSLALVAAPGWPLLLVPAAWSLAVVAVGESARRTLLRAGGRR